MTNPRVFYTSDLHIGHRLVSGVRGFWMNDPLSGDIEVQDTEAHDAWLADLWDGVVRPGDTVWVLGDISINGKQPALDWVKQRPGTKHLISGNHDPVHPSFRTAHKLLPLWSEYFETIQPFARRKLLGKSVLLSHFPYSGTGSEGHGVEERYSQYRLPDLGLPLLHGHTHGTEIEHFSDQKTPELHVGIDAWKSLVSQDQVISWVESLS